MGRIVAKLKVQNGIDPKKSILCNALVDTGASRLILPMAWKKDLGKLEVTETTEMELANQETMTAQICGPVKVKVEEFAPVFTDVVFIEMKPNPDGMYEPLIGCIVLEQAQATVDMVNHVLVKGKKFDLKGNKLVERRRPSRARR